MVYVIQKALKFVKFSLKNINMSRILSRLFFWNLKTPITVLSTQKCTFRTGYANLQEEEIHPPSNEPSIPPYEEKADEPLKVKRARLLYQSRKRGVSENGILLATFADKHLKTMDEELLSDYDRLINLPTNDWDIYNWITEAKPTPVEFDNKVMDMLKEHVKNKDRSSRLRQPDRLVSFS
ncbi:succinate dehydrogenase assembly factor 2, mitochondrial-like [Lycorma delicatula]|uniref:succinate dehydrogenase assembly factor 2, mitochondrial-like n=1 Tax=Lycorma delicatula TaxID=130591 RepID=UPI003F50EC3B